jgi:hypothetical protein
MVDDETFGRYLEQGVIVTLTVRPTVRLGDTLGYRNDFEARTGSGSATLTRMWLDLSEQQVVLGGDVHRLGGSSGRSLDGGNRGSSWSSVPFRALTDGTLPLGEHPVELLAHAKVTAGPFTHKWDLKLTDTVRIVPRDTQSVKLIDDEALAAQVERAVTVDKLTVRNDDGRWRVNIEVNIEKRPAGLAHRIIVVQGDKRHDLGAISKPGDGSTRWHLGGSVDGPIEAGLVDVILEPDIDKAHGSVDVFDLWNRPILFKDVPLEVEDEKQ